jgi:hypothetical protein
VFDAENDYAPIVTHPDHELMEAARSDSGQWREPIGAFQVSIPVSTEEDTLLHRLQLLSIMSWRIEHRRSEEPLDIRALSDLAI